MLTSARTVTADVDWRDLLEGDDPEVVRRALEGGADLGPCDDDGRTPLMLAARRGCQDAIIQLLIGFGADVDARDRAGRTALMHAIEGAPSATVVGPVRTEHEGEDAATSQESVEEETESEQALREFADSIVAALRSGAPAWVRPWSKSRYPSVPFNLKSGRRYNALNALIFFGVAARNGYEHHAWVPSTLVSKLGASVLPGETPATGFKYFPPYRKATVKEGKPDSAQAGDAEGPKRPERERERTVTHVIPTARPAIKAFEVYNVAQLESLPKRLLRRLRPRANVDPPGFAPVQQLIRCLGADVRHGGDRAFYNRAHDFISLPWQDQFETLQAYYATSVHEHVHWTGHSERKGRRFGTTFGDEAYALEELVAEFATAYMCALLGVDGQFEQSVAYIDSWIRRISEEPLYLFHALTLAGGAVDFMKKQCPATFE